MLRYNIYKTSIILNSNTTIIYKMCEGKFAYSTTATIYFEKINKWIEIKTVCVCVCASDVKWEKSWWPDFFFISSFFYFKVYHLARAFICYSKLTGMLCAHVVLLIWPEHSYGDDLITICSLLLHQTTIAIDAIHMHIHFKERRRKKTTGFRSNWWAWHRFVWVAQCTSMRAFVYLSKRAHSTFNALNYLLIRFLFLYNPASDLTHWFRCDAKPIHNKYLCLIRIYYTEIYACVSGAPVSVTVSTFATTIMREYVLHTPHTQRNQIIFNTRMYWIRCHPNVQDTCAYSVCVYCIERTILAFRQYQFDECIVAWL